MYNYHFSAHMVLFIICIITDILVNYCEIRDFGLFSSTVKYSGRKEEYCCAF